jgi:hypothetical protein
MRRLLLSCLLVMIGSAIGAHSEDCIARQMQDPHLVCHLEGTVLVRLVNEYSIVIAFDAQAEDGSPDGTIDDFFFFVSKTPLRSPFPTTPCAARIEAGVSVLKVIPHDGPAFELAIPLSTVDDCSSPAGVTRYCARCGLAHYRYNATPYTVEQMAAGDFPQDFACEIADGQAPVTGSGSSPLQ